MFTCSIFGQNVFLKLVSFFQGSHQGGGYNDHIFEGARHLRGPRSPRASTIRVLNYLDDHFAFMYRSYNLNRVTFAFMAVRPLCLWSFLLYGVNFLRGPSLCLKLEDFLECPVLCR